MIRSFNFGFAINLGFNVNLFIALVKGLWIYGLGIKYTLFDVFFMVLEIYTRSVCLMICYEYWEVLGCISLLFKTWGSIFIEASIFNTSWGRYLVWVWRWLDSILRESRKWPLRFENSSSGSRHWVWNLALGNSLSSNSKFQELRLRVRPHDICRDPFSYPINWGVENSRDIES